MIRELMNRIKVVRDCRDIAAQYGEYSDDISQEVFCKLLESETEYDDIVEDTASFLELFAILARREYQNAKNWQKKHTPLTDDIQCQVYIDTTGILDAVDKLPGIEKTIVTFRLRGEKFREISETLSININSVYAAYRRALPRLAAILAAEV